MMYSRVLKDVIEKGYMSAAEDKVLVVCGGSYDASVLREVGFKLAVSAMWTIAARANIAHLNGLAKMQNP